MRVDRKVLLRAVSKFLLVNFLLSLALGYRYVPDGLGFGSMVFVWVSLVANTFMLYLPLALLGFLSIFVVPHRKFTLYFNVILLFLFQFLLLVDTVVYAIYKFHINGAVITIFTSGGFGDSVSLGSFTTILAVVVLLGFFLLEFFLLRFFVNSLHIGGYKKRVKLSIFVWIGFAFLLTDKLTYAVADMYNVTSVIRFVKVFPLYQPLTIKSFMEKSFGFKIDREDAVSLSTQEQSLNYPKSPLIYGEAEAARPNILVIFFDAWRYDMFTPEVTPNVWNFSQKSSVFTQHYSGGNASRFGVFSLFYGISGYYWHKVLGERRSCVLIDELQGLGYDFYISASTRLTYPEFRKTCFINIPEYLHDKIEGENAVEKDPKLAKGFVEYLHKRKEIGEQKPFFSFLFFDAPHGTDYPAECEKFTPTQRSVNYLKIDDDQENVKMMRNTYKNAIYFDDALIEQVLNTLEDDGYLENTIIVFSADHGQEFYENGFFGHCSAFDKYQTKVPFIVYWPGKEPVKYDKMTSHLDFVPTILAELGVSNPASDYSQGKDLWADDGHKFVQSSGWDDAALIYPDGYFVFSVETYKAGLFEVRDEDYKLQENQKERVSQKRGDLLKTIKGFSEFSR